MSVICMPSTALLETLWHGPLTTFILCIFMVRNIVR